jgi:uncharacterized membrane protein HdeD (DUF308 family)
MDDDRPRFIERQAPAQTPQEATQRRAATMIGIGALALVFGLVTLVNSGSSVALLVGLLGIGLLVGGLVIRR